MSAQNHDCLLHSRAAPATTGEASAALFPSRCRFAVVAAMLASSCGQDPTVTYETSVDPGGCILEHVAVAPGVNQFYYDGVSPDGEKLAIGWDRGGQERGLYVLDLRTGARTDIPDLDNGGVFSPDGEKLLLIVRTDNGKTDVAEYDLATGDLTPIAPHEDWEWLASYSSDGALIAFNSYRTGASDIYTYRKSDGALKRWTDFDGYEAHAQFSPDDGEILFHRQDDGDDYNVYVIDTATGEIAQLTSDASEESYASWSPDGDVIVFASDRNQESGETDLYVMESSGENMRRLTDHAAKDSYPFFSPDGQNIYFHSDRDPPGLYRLALDANMNCVKRPSDSGGN